MLCVKTETSTSFSIASHREMFGSSQHGPFRATASLGSQIQKAMQRVGGKRLSGSRKSTDQASDTASCSGIEDDKRSDSGRSEGSISEKTKTKYKYQLEEEVKKLQKQLQEEIDLHLALANAVAHDSMPTFKSPAIIPYKTQELLATIASLETAVSELEKELDSLQYRLCHERNERLLAETHIRGCSRSFSSAPSPSASHGTWEESISSLRDLKFGGSNLAQLVQQDDMLSEYSNSNPQRTSEGSLSLLDGSQEGETLMQHIISNEENKTRSLSFDEKSELADSILINTKRNLWTNPNQLSEEMVRCMRNIFLCLSESIKLPSSPEGQLSLSDSSAAPSMQRSTSVESSRSEDNGKEFDPYKVNKGKVNFRDIGRYGSTVEVSWMSVGKEQLEYASDALMKFRSLVEQLGKVNPANLSSDERLAFWINLFNALIMHAYLAYGVPKNDIKLFSLMQKACYTIGGLSVSAAEIEFVILKMKAPVHRPQLALMLALHKFKITEEHKKFALEGPEPMALFALSCGMFSSPAVRIFSAENVRAELQMCMRDYIRASVGVNEKGKILVPKLLHTYAKGIVEDSLLVDWISHHLSHDQIMAIRDSALQKRQRLLSARSFTVVPFDTKFRYLFLQDDTIENGTSSVLKGSA
ncbi:hypothetical protein LUZ62_089052 [Rhynchospora pubera]|uniref:Ternary complex factor MIP1, leucine-zipper n=1 Tax=Rhynchospora pubera TaxID=906938 RepID=A0AAV8CJK5_9POAL|nr:hypothetical protein LUZ62_089052 [Rhynchospora pubera]